MSTAIEATRPSSMFSYKNLVFDPDSRIYSSNEDTRYPASNLLTPIRGKPFKSASSGKCSIIVDLGFRTTIDYVECLGLVDTNLISGSTIRLKASNNRASIDVSPDAYWDIEIWTVRNGVFIFVLGTPSSGIFLSKKFRYWQLDLPANGGGSGVQHSLGVLWLGKIHQHGFDVKTDFKLSTNMDSTKLTTGGKQTKFIETVYDLDFEIVGLTTEDAYEFKYDLETMNINRYMIVDYFSFSDNENKRAHGVFYGYMDKGSITFKAGAPKLVDVTFNFNEMPQLVT